MDCIQKIDNKTPSCCRIRESKTTTGGTFYGKGITHVQELLSRILAMKRKGYTYRQIADRLGLKKEQVEDLCQRERRKERKIAHGYIPQPKGRLIKTPATQDDLQKNRIFELEMKVELLQNFLSECGRM